MKTTRHISIRTYHPTSLSLVVGVILVPVLILLTWPVASLLGDARTLIVEFVFVPLFSVVALGTILHGYSFVFNEDDKALTMQRRVLLFRVGNAVRTQFANITDMEWTADAVGDGPLYLTLNDTTRFAVTMNRRKARLIMEMVSRVHPNLQTKPMI